MVIIILTGNHDPDYQLKSQPIGDKDQGKTKYVEKNLFASFPIQTVNLSFLWHCPQPLAPLNIQLILTQALCTVRKQILSAVDLNACKSIDQGCQGRKCRMSWGEKNRPELRVCKRKNRRLSVRAASVICHEAGTWHKVHRDAHPAIIG